MQKVLQFFFFDKMRSVSIFSDQVQKMFHFFLQKSISVSFFFNKKRKKFSVFFNKMQKTASYFLFVHKISIVLFFSKKQ